MFKTADLITFMMEKFEYQIYDWKRDWHPDDKWVYGSAGLAAIHNKLNGFHEFICNDLAMWERSSDCDEGWLLQCFTGMLRRNPLWSPKEDNFPLDHNDEWCKNFILIYTKDSRVRLFYLSKSTLDQISITNPDWWIAIDPPPSEKADLSDSGSLDKVNKFIESNNVYS